jgi:hypothetical protein
MSRSHKKITYNRLKNIAYFYLERFDASSMHLKEVLNRRVLKAKFIITKIILRQKNGLMILSLN